MNLSELITKTTQTIKSNSPEILTALGVSGVVTTSYLVAKASFRAARVIEQSESQGGTHSDPKERFKERTKLVWKLYIPAGLSGAATCACVLGASRAGARRTAAAVTAYTLTERAFSDYKDKVVETIGDHKEQRVRDELAQEKVLKNPEGSNQVLIAGSGKVLCCEGYTGRYFQSTMEDLRRAQNDVNARAIGGLYVTLSYFYDLLNLKHTSISGNVGWDSTRQMELDFHATLTEQGEPCMVFEYNPEPQPL